MESIDFDVLNTALAWHEQGHRVLLGTVTHTWGSAPRPVGSMMAIRGDGHVRGSVSGGCVEDDLIRRIQGGELERTLPFALTYGLTADEAHRFGLPCGGTLEIMMEPVSAQSRITELLAAVRQGLRVTRTLDLDTGAATLATDSEARQTVVQDRKLIAPYGPRYRLVIIGAAQMSRYVAQFALALDYQVIVCDPREEYLHEWDIPGVELSGEMPDDLLLRLQLDANSAVVTLTHDPKLDDMALISTRRAHAPVRRYRCRWPGTSWTARREPTALPWSPYPSGWRPSNAIHGMTTSQPGSTLPKKFCRRFQWKRSRHDHPYRPAGR
nr:XdhC family protein [Herbaspirillum lusitanum]